MCSIAGIISPDQGDVDPAVLERMNRSMAHRGPDGHGYFYDHRNGLHIGFAHNRLAIIDPTDLSAQPFEYKERYQVIFNGEIYNYKEIRDQLTQKGYLFRSTGDTEVVIAAFDAFGTKCLDHFDGMFSFAVWDRKDCVLFCARDRFGEKPFYYHFDEDRNRFFFSSEIKGLFEAGVAKEFDPTMLYNFLTLGFTKRPDLPQRTFFKNIFQLPASHYLIYKPLEQQLETGRYWDLDKETVTERSETEILDQFRSLLETAVARRLRSDVPVGTSLSGGLDSSSIAAMIADHPVDVFSYKAFSAVFPGFEKDESEKINSIAAHFKLDLNTVTPDGHEFAEHLDELVKIQDEPFGSGSVFAQYMVYAAAKASGVKVLLDGQGADEVLAGYTRYTHWYLQELINSEGWGTANEQAVIYEKNNFLKQWGLKNFVAAKLPALTASQLEKRSVRQQRDNRYIHKDFANDANDRRSIFKPTVDKLNDIQYFDVMMMGLEELLRYADRNSMAHGVEIRLPYLSHELVQFVFSLPSSYKLRDGFTKWILRKTMAHRLPDSICWQQGKIGFEPPQKMWMQLQATQQLVKSSREKLVDMKICNEAILSKPIMPSEVHDKDNFDFRSFVAGIWLR
jgi:asparagine synthase (glutamine-hydrolysing)